MLGHPWHRATLDLLRMGVRHRAEGCTQVLIVVFPKFDHEDERFD